MAVVSRDSDRGAGRDRSYARHSNGLEQFFAYIQGEHGLALLDLAGASQASLSFITGLGHRLYSEDLLENLDQVFGGGDFYSNQCAPEAIERFLELSLHLEEESCDGALVWDLLEYLAPPLLRAVVDRLRRILKPRAYLLAIFHGDDRTELVPTYFYRIADACSLALAPRGLRPPAQLFNNRGIEKLFQGFEAVKFFLTRDHLREVIVKR